MFKSINNVTLYWNYILILINCIPKKLINTTWNRCNHCLYYCPLRWWGPCIESDNENMQLRSGPPREIHHHPSHLEHPLLLTYDSPTRDGTPCDCCGEKLLSPCYICPTCKFKVDFICGMKPSPPAIEQPMYHDHSLVFLKKQQVHVPCEACKKSIGGPSYSCLECHVYFHLDCVHLSKEVNHPSHPSHPLKVVASESLADNQDAEKSCCFCGVQQEKMMYHCSICNFTVCFGCTKNNTSGADITCSYWSFRYSLTKESVRLKITSASVYYIYPALAKKSLNR